ncbi:ABC transporter permease [Zafaria sp. Z1313]|uniref:ABC transporter permease n=1 Tax=unclassified Zafaria TaxID=2828765 RepID=UPI003D301BD9
MAAAGAVLATAVALVPAAYLVVRTLEYGPAALLGQLFTERIARLTATSLLLVAVVTALCLVIGVALAVLVTRTSVPGRRALAVAAALPLAVPSYVAAFGWTSLVGLFDVRAGFEGFWAAVFVLTLVTYPYVYLAVSASLLSVDAAHEEAARALGHSPARTFLKVTLPLVLPAVAAGGLLCALYILADFGGVSILRVDTFTRAIFTSFNMGFDRLGAVALSSVLLALTVLILLVESRFRRTGTRYARLGSGVRRPHALLPLGRFGVPAAAAAWLLVGVAVGGPLAAMGVWSVRGVSRPGSLAEVAAAFGGSVWAAGLGALATTALAVPLGIAIARSGSRWPRLAERLVYLAHSLPGVVVGLSVVFLGINVAYAFYQTQWLLTLAYCTLFLPLALGPVVGAVLLAPPQAEEAAAALGRGPVRVFLKVTLPLALPGIASGALLVLLTAVKELPATLMLRPTGFETLATRLWTHTSVNAYAAAAPYAALLVLLAIAPTWILVARVFREKT